MNNCTQIEMILTFCSFWHFSQPGFCVLNFQLIDTLNNNFIFCFISVGSSLSKNMTKYHKTIDWKNDQERLDFEEEIKKWKARRQEWTWCETIIWILEIFVLNFLVILVLYGGQMNN